MDQNTLTQIQAAEQEAESCIQNARKQAEKILEEARARTETLRRQGIQRGREEGELESRKSLESAEKQVREIETRNLSEIDTIRKTIGEKAEPAAINILKIILKD